jgi:hypothetical protein
MDGCNQCEGQQQDLHVGIALFVPKMYVFYTKRVAPHGRRFAIFALFLHNFGCASIVTSLLHMTILARRRTKELNANGQEGLTE